MNERDNGVTIADLCLMMGRVEGKVDGLKDTIERHLADDQSTHTQHDKRIAGLERGRAYVYGVFGLAAVLWGAFIAFVPSMLDALKSIIKGA